MYATTSGHTPFRIRWFWLSDSAHFMRIRFCRSCSRTSHEAPFWKMSAVTTILSQRRFKVARGVSRIFALHQTVISTAPQAARQLQSSRGYHGEHIFQNVVSGTVGTPRVDSFFRKGCFWLSTLWATMRVEVNRSGLLMGLVA